MPEFPEVNHQVRYLQGHCRGWRIASFGWRGAQHFKNISLPRREAVLQDFLLGNAIEDVTQKGKHIIIKTERGSMLSHMMFKGRWSVADDPYTSNYKQYTAIPTIRTSSFWLETEDGQRLDLHTPDHKAHITAHPGQRVPARIPRLGRLGPEVVERAQTDPSFDGGEWSLDRFRAQARRADEAIKVFLLDQRRQAGLGNMYVCEALYEAGVAPMRKANGLSLDELEAIHTAARRVMHEAVDSFLDYDTVLKVYRREADPWGNGVVQSRVGGRPTFWVPEFQK